MTSKGDLAKENEKTREVKEREETIKEKGKEAVHDAKIEAQKLAGKAEKLDIKDAPELLPSANRVDQKLKDAKDSIEEAKTARLGETDLSKYPKIQQVFCDTQRILDDNRAIVKEMNKDNTLSETAHHTAEFAQLIKDQSVVTLDKLWTNWAALLAVVAGTSAGSWKQILQESGNFLSQLNNTQDFIKLLTDLQQTFVSLSKRSAKAEPVGEKLYELNQEWEKQRTQLLEDWKKIWAVLNESPLWKNLIAKGKALKEQAAKVAGETKEEVEKQADAVADSAEAKKLKEDFKNVLQLIVGKDGPDVQPFLDYCSAAYKDIIENEDYSQWASEMSECFESLSKTEHQSAEEYQKQMDKLQEQTKKLLDNTVDNENLKCALRESRKLLRAAKKDPATKKLLKDSNRLLAHMSGKTASVLDPQLLNEIRAVIVPLLIDHLDNTPLPDYHGKDSNALGTFDYTLSGIRLATSGLIPSKIKVEFRYKAEANPSKLRMERQHMYMYLEASDIQLAFKDVKWHYNRHTIPRFSDEGTIDFATDKKGITLRLKAELNDYQPPEHAHSLGELLAEPKERHMFTILKAECDIDDFHVRVSDAGGPANVFYEMLAGIWGTKIKHQIESLIESKMNLLAQKFDSQLYDIVRRATQPSLAEETKEALISAGQAAGERAKEAVEDAKKSLQSM